MAGRAAWEEATRRQRQLAIAADAGLRRRHPGQHYAPLRSAEPEPLTPDRSDEPALTAEEDLMRTEALLGDVAAQRHDSTRLFAERNDLLPPAQRSDHVELGMAFPARTSEARDAILQPPKPQIEPSPRILERVTGYALDLEAAD